MFNPSSRLFLCMSIVALLCCASASAQRTRPKPAASPAPTPPVQLMLPSVPASPPTLTQQIETLSDQIETGITSSNNRTVAVVEFVDLVGNVTNFGRFLAEELTTLLYQKRFKVIERRILRKVIEEQKLSLTGVIDQTSAQRLGKVLGVGAIVSGTVTDLGQTLRVNARLVSTETGEIISVASVTILKDQSVITLMQQPTSTGQSSVSNQSANTTATRPEVSNKPRRIDVQFLIFELTRCRKSTTSVLCEFVVTNNDKDRQLYLSTFTLYDEFGNEARGQRAEVANSGNSALLVSGIPVAVRISFEGVSPKATKISLLTLRGRIAFVRFEGDFRNVPLTN